MMDRDANIVARYIYDPYGNTLLANGDMAEANPLRYSSEFHNRVTGLTDYLYRSYNPTDGRWTQRDPIQEQGGVNLYGFFGNDPANRFDKWGLVPTMKELLDAAGDFSFDENGDINECLCEKLGKIIDTIANDPSVKDYSDFIKAIDELDNIRHGISDAIARKMNAVTNDMSSKQYSWDPK